MPFTADSVAAQQVQDCLKQVYALVHEIEKKRQASEQGMNAIAKYQAAEEKGRNHSVSVRQKQFRRMKESQTIYLAN